MGSFRGTDLQEGTRKVMLRSEIQGRDQRYLWAYVDADGDLHVDGQDLGPGTAIVSHDGEYEWFQTIRASDVPRLIGLLGGPDGADILDLLEERWTGSKAGAFERVLRESSIPVARHVWGG